MFFLFALLVPSFTQADLTGIGTANYGGNEYKLIWDDNNNGKSLVWLDYTHIGNAWSAQRNWAENLGSALTVSILHKYTTDIDWSTGCRLPTAGVHPDYIIDESISEMGHLYYEVIGFV